MPKYTVEVSAHLQEIDFIRTPPEYCHSVTLSCGHCGEKPPKPIPISTADTVAGVRGAEVNLRITCKFCGRSNDVKILSEGVYTAEKAPEWGEWLVLECRGVQPLAWGDGDETILCGSEEGLVEDGEWYGYDENKGVELSVTEFRTRVVRS